MHSEHYLKWNAAGAKEEELVFVSGNPGATQRNVAFSTYRLFIDTIYPSWLEKLQNLLATDEAYAKRGPEEGRQSQAQIFGLQNAVKAIGGTAKAGSDPDLITRKRTEEQEFKSKINSNPEWKKEFGSAWASIAEADQRYITRVKFRFAYRLDSHLDQIAQNIVEYVAEVNKPAAERSGVSRSGAVSLYLARC